MEVKMENSRIFRRSKDVPRFTRIEVLESKARHLNVMIFVLIEGSSADIGKRGKKELFQIFRQVACNYRKNIHVFISLISSAVQSQSCNKKFTVTQIKIREINFQFFSIQHYFHEFFVKKVWKSLTLRREISSYAKIS